MQCQVLFSRKIKKNMTHLLTSELALEVVKVTFHCGPNSEEVGGPYFFWVVHLSIG